jgi:hypothetical protein
MILAKSPMWRIQINKKKWVCGGVDCAEPSNDRLHVLLFVNMEQTFGFYFVACRATISNSRITLLHRISHLFSSTNEANCGKDAHDFTSLQQWISLTVTRYTVHPTVRIPQHITGTCVTRLALHHQQCSHDMIYTFIRTADPFVLASVVAYSS